MEKKFYYPDKIKTHVAAETEAPDTESIQSFDQIIEEEEQSFPQKEQDQPEIDEEDTPANDLALVPSYNNRSITTPEQKSILRGVAGEYLKLVKTIERQIQVASPKPGLSVAAEQCCELARRMKFNEKEKESSMKLSFVELFRRRVQYDRMGVPLSVNEVIYLDDYEREWRHMESILSDSDQYIDDNQPDSSKQAEAIMELGYSSNSVDNDTRPIQTQTHQRKLRPNRQHGHENDRDLFGNESCGCICPNTQRASGGSELAMGGYAERFDLPQNRACGAYQTYSGAPTKPEKHKLYDYTGTNFSPQFHGGRRRQKPGSQENINLSLYPENSNPYEYDRNILLEDGRHLHVHEAHACAPKFDEKKYLDEYEKQLSNEHKERSHNSKVADSSRSHKNDRQHSTGKHRKEYEDARHPTQFPQNTPNSRREYDRQIVMENRPQAHNYFETSNVSEVPNSAPQYPDEYYPLNQNRQTMDQQQQRLPDYVDERNASTYYNRHHVGRQEKQLKKEQRNQMKPQEKGQSESGDRLHHQRSLHCSERRNSSGLYDSKQSERIYKDLSEEKEHQLSQYVEAKYSAECQRNPNEVSKDQAMELNCNASRSHRRQYCGQSEKEKPEYEKCLLGKEHPPVDGLQGSYIARHLERASVQPPIERQLANAWTESEPVSFKNRRHCNDEHCSAKHTTDNKEIQSYRVEEDRTKPHISYQSSRPNLYDQPACLCQSPVFTHQSPQRHRKDSNRSLSAIEKPTPVPSRAASPSSSTHSDVPSDYRDCLVYAKKRTIPLSRSPSTDQPWMTMERSPVAPTTCQESAAQPDKGMPLSYSCTPCPCAERQVKQNQQQHVPQNKQMWQMTCGVNRQSLPSHICELCRQRSSSMVGSLYQNHSSPIANIQISHRNHPPPPSCPVHPSHPNCSAGIAYRSSRSSPLECKKCQLQISPPKCCCMPHPSWPLTMIPPSTPCGCGTSKLSDCNCDGNNYRNRSNHVKDMNRFRKEVVAHSLLVEGHALPPPRLHESPDQALASSSRRTGHARIKAGEVKCKYETEEGKQQNKLPPYELHSVEAMSRIATEKRQHQHCRFKDLVSEECFDSQSDSQSEQVLHRFKVLWPPMLGSSAKKGANKQRPEKGHSKSTAKRTDERRSQGKPTRSEKKNGASHTIGDQIQTLLAPPEKRELPPLHNSSDESRTARSNHPEGHESEQDTSLNYASQVESDELAHRRAVTTKNKTKPDKFRPPFDLTPDRLTALLKAVPKKSCIKKRHEPRPCDSGSELDPPHEKTEQAYDADSDTLSDGTIAARRARGDRLMALASCNSLTKVWHLAEDYDHTNGYMPQITGGLYSNWDKLKYLPIDVMHAGFAGQPILDANAQRTAPQRGAYFAREFAKLTKEQREQDIALRMGQLRLFQHASDVNYMRCLSKNGALDWQQLNAHDIDSVRHSCPLNGSTCPPQLNEKLLSHFICEHLDEPGMELREIFEHERLLLIFSPRSFQYGINACMSVLAYGGIRGYSNTLPIMRYMPVYNAGLSEQFAHFTGHLPLLVMICRARLSELNCGKRVRFKDESRPAAEPQRKCQNISDFDEDDEEDVLCLWIASMDLPQPLHVMMTVFNRRLDVTRSSIMQVRGLCKSHRCHDFVHTSSHYMRLSESDLRVLTNESLEPLYLEVSVREYAANYPLIDKTPCQQIT